MRIVFLLLLLPALSHAINLENAKRINKTCALCHGQYGQGTPGMNSPRLAGLPTEYLAKELRHYRSGFRAYPPMVVTSQIKDMTDLDIADIANYLAGIDLREMGLPEVPNHAGDIEAGQAIYNKACRSCHRRDGLGKVSKGIPPLAGQYGGYLMGQIKKFQDKKRDHAEDPDDDTFDDLEQSTLDNIVAYVTRMPPFVSAGGVAGMIGTQDHALANVQGATTLQETLAEYQEDNTSDTVETTARPAAGRFKVLPSGDILLILHQKDLRQMAGLQGIFRLLREGEIVFIPDTPDVRTQNM
jgi:cytochrome c553